jgi:hypothetical protein
VQACLPAVPAIAAVAATITTAPAASAAASTTTTAVAAASAASTAAIAAASAATTAAALCLGPCFVHHEVSPAEILPVERIHGAVRIFVIIYFDKCESTRLSSKPVANQIDARGSNTDLREPLVELIFRRGKRKIPDIELLHLPTPSARNPNASRGAR